MAKSLNIRLYYYQSNFLKSSRFKVKPKHYDHYLKQVMEKAHPHKSLGKETTLKNTKFISTVVSADSLDRAITYDYHYDGSRFIFIRMSKPQDLVNMSKQDLDTLEHTDIELDGDEVIIKSSYLLIDCNNGAMAFLYNRSTPSIDSLTTLINGEEVNTIKGRLVKLLFDPVKLTNEVILDKEDIKHLSTLEASIALPIYKVTNKLSLFGASKSANTPKINNKKTTIKISGLSVSDEEVQSTIDLINALKEIDSGATEDYRVVDKLYLHGNLQDTEKYVTKHDLLDAKLNTFTKIPIENGFKAINPLEIFHTMKLEYERIEHTVSSKLTTE